MMRTQSLFIRPKQPAFFGTDNGCHPEVFKYFMRAHWDREKKNFPNGGNAERRQPDHESRGQRHVSLGELRDSEYEKRSKDGPV